MLRAQGKANYGTYGPELQCRGGEGKEDSLSSHKGPGANPNPSRALQRQETSDPAGASTSSSRTLDDSRAPVDSGLEFGQRFRAFHHLASCLASASSPGSGISPSVACNGMDLLVC